MRKITLAVLVGNEASLAELGAALTSAASDAAGQIIDLDHVANLYPPAGVVDRADRWACNIEHVSLLG